MEVQSKCICVEGCHSPNEPRQYPEWKDKEGNLETFRKNGYMVVREMYTEAEVKEAKEEISKTIKEWFEGTEQEGKDWEEVVNR